MKRETSGTVIALVPLLWLLVACTVFGTPAEIPTAATTPTQNDARTAVAPTGAPTQVPTAPQPTSKLTLTPTALATKAAKAPEVISFTVAPTTTRRLGDKFTATWQATGTRAVLCPTIYGYAGEPVQQVSACSDVPLAGTKSITVDEISLTWSGVQLSVFAGDSKDSSWVHISAGCDGFRDWFFGNAPLVCPQAAATHSPAAAQHFERGLMVWVKQPDTFYIFYETSQQPPRVFEEIHAPYRFRPGASPNNRAGETPPRGLYEPVSGFGQLWRGEIEGAQNVRQRLGWAKEPESSFNTSYQCEIALFPRLWNCYLGSPDGKVLALRPDSTAGVHLIWNVR